MFKVSRVAATCAYGLLAICWPGAGAQAQGFSAYVSPPRFELRLTAGQTRREVFDIEHAGSASGAYRFYTNDWDLRPDGSVSFTDALAPDSCRPWVAIERRELQLEAQGRYRYRFEITPPPGTAARECRFALMVEGKDPTPGALGLGGRIAVIVYAAVGDASPRLSVRSTRVDGGSDRHTAVLEVHNSGNAHGRLEGFLDATDAQGVSLELSPADHPILPGQTRHIPLVPVAPEGGQAPVPRFPMRVDGTLESGGQRLPVRAQFVP